MIVVQLVPRLPPAIDGVGDYALNLARQLCKDFRIVTHFVVGDPAWNGETKIEAFPVYCLSQRSELELKELLTKLKTSTVLLNYVGYGFAKRGYPKWLLNGLKMWLRENKNYRIVTMFHEVYATSNRPWTSSFWLSDLQRQIAAQLTVLSHSCFTSTHKYAEILERFDPTKQNQITVMPIFSGIGEPERNVPLDKRNRRLVIFGNTHNRARVYQKLYKPLELICEALSIDEIYDIGPLIVLDSYHIKNVPIIQTGVQQANIISQILQDSIAGFMSYPPASLLAKSSIFGAYCAHGMMPIVSQLDTSPVDDLVAFTHYWVVDDTLDSLSVNNVQNVADKAYIWYQNHRISVQAKIISEYLI